MALNKYSETTISLSTQNNQNISNDLSPQASVKTNFPKISLSLNDVELGQPYALAIPWANANPQVLIQTGVSLKGIFPSHAGLVSLLIIPTVNEVIIDVFLEPQISTLFNTVLNILSPILISYVLKDDILVFLSLARVLIVVNINLIIKQIKNKPWTPFVIIFQVLIFISAYSTIKGNPNLTDKISIYAYYSLATSVILWIISNVLLVKKVEGSEVQSSNERATILSQEEER